MRKKERYYPVNNQEDEDGYTLYPENAVFYENEKKEKDISHYNTANTGPGPEKLRFRTESHSQPAKQE